MPKPIHRAEYAAVRTLLRELRMGAGIKQSELCHALGKPQPYISAIETGNRRVDIVEIRDICGVLGVTLPDFVVALEAAIGADDRKRKPVRRRVG